MQLGAALAVLGAGLVVFEAEGNRRSPSMPQVVDLGSLAVPSVGGTGNTPKR